MRIGRLATVRGGRAACQLVGGGTGSARTDGGEPPGCDRRRAAAGQADLRHETNHCGCGVSRPATARGGQHDVGRPGFGCGVSQLRPETGQRGRNDKAPACMRCRGPARRCSANSPIAPASWPPGQSAIRALSVPTAVQETRQKAGSLAFQPEIRLPGYPARSPVPSSPARIPVARSSGQRPSFRPSGQNSGCPVLQPQARFPGPPTFPKSPSGASVFGGRAVLLPGSCLAQDP